MSFISSVFILIIGILPHCISLQINANNRLKIKTLQPISTLLEPRSKDLEVVFYNTLSRKKEVFEAINHPHVKFYSCGPTVYDYAHVGNFRAFLTYDLIKRWLQYCGYQVDHVCNLTDIDDKIINKMNSEKKSLKEITEKYSEAFFEDLQVLNIFLAQRYPRATQHIDDIQAMIESLVNKGSAYEEQGSVYFRVSSFPSYGELAKMDFSKIQDGAGGSGPNERRGLDDKESFRDFALWKASDKDDSDDITWDSRFGRGRPGWHIECSAMCSALLGDTIDIHAGGVDLVFPHHQNEIAQSEAYSGKLYSKFWMHNGFININNEKMSKSLQNFRTLRDVAKTPVEARAFRFMVLSAQYRASLSFTDNNIAAAVKSIRRIDTLIEKLSTITSETKKDSTIPSKPFETNSENMESQPLVNLASQTIIEFERAMCDDLGTPRAVAALFTMVSVTEKALNARENGSGNVTNTEATNILEAFRTIDSVFGVFYDVPTTYFRSSSTSKISEDMDKIMEEVKVLAQKRLDLKLQKLYNEADEIRKQINALGYEVKDTKDGFLISPILS